METTRQRSPLPAKVSAVLGLGLAAFYCSSLAILLYSIYGPGHGRCGTGQVGALALGAVVVAPIALLLVFAIARFRAGIPARRIWQAIASLAVVALLVAVGINWFILFRLVVF
jgi:hypothetical protein